MSDNEIENSQQTWLNNGTRTLETLMQAGFYQICILSCYLVLIVASVHSKLTEDLAVTETINEQFLWSEDARFTDV